MRAPQILLSLVVFVALLAVAFLFHGTAGSGDSPNHFLYAMYAFKHPHLFFDHWAKPLFVLLSSPFAQFGFIGMKVFNVTVATLTGFIVMKLAVKMNPSHPLPLISLALLFLIQTYTLLIFSGFTEPLFALVLALGVYLSFSQKHWQAVTLISFLPFVRSEGLIIICVYIIYLILKKEWKLLPMLLLGHVVYGLAGAWHYGTVFWPITSNPYAGHAGYKSGGAFDFVSKLYYVCGLPMFVMLCLGVVALLVSSFYLRDKRFTKEEVWLVYGCFAAYLVAHSIFWFFSLFHTMGLNRVLIGVAPVIALIAARGIWMMDVLIKKRWIVITISSLLIGFAVIFPFTKNPAALDFDDLLLDQDQQLIEAEIAPLLLGQYDGWPVFYDAPYVALASNLDPFIPQDHPGPTNADFNAVDGPYLVVWDAWFSVVEAGVQLDRLEQNASVKELMRLTNEKGEVRLAVFESVR